MIDIIQSAAKNINRKKSRTFLTMIGVCIGVASVVIISCISSLGSSLINTELDSLGMSGLLVGCNSNLLTSSLSFDDFETIKSVNAVKDATPIVVESTEAGSKIKKDTTMVWGIDISASEVVSMQLLHGRFLNKSDINGYQRCCIVDQTFAQSIYKRDNIVGKEIIIRLGNTQEEYTVVGVIKTGSGILSGSIMGNILPSFVYVPYTVVQENLGTTNFQQIITRANEGEDIKMLSKEITNKLESKNGTKNSYVITDLSEHRDSLSGVLNIVTLVLTAIGGVSLVVASLSIMTVMLVSVNERTREIGIKKSIGAKNSDIMKEFITEAMLISLLGCILGLVLGFAFSGIGASIFGLEMSLDMGLIAFSFVFALSTGVVFGVYPAYKASRLSPVEALRDD